MNVLIGSRIRLSAALAILSFGLVSADYCLAAFGDGNSAQQETENRDPLTATAKFRPASVEPGGTTEILIDLQLAENYHAYLERLKLTIDSPDDLKLAHFKVTPVVEFFDTVTKSQKKGIEGKSLMRAVLEVPSGFKTGDYKVKFSVGYQACTTEHCLFPKALHLELPLTVGNVLKAAPPIGAEPAPAPGEGERHSLEDILGQGSRGLLSSLFLVFLAGLLTAFTPCIYPMIPITLSVLGARAHHRTHVKNFTLSVTYVLGIALTYSLLGLVAASTGGLFGSALGNIWVVSGIALVFLAMGLSMFGLFEVQAPGFLRNRLGHARSSHGLSGAFVTGLLAGVVASPCIGPVLVALLAHIAKTQNHATGFIMLFTFAFGMGVPFIILGMSSSALARLPKAGSWMDWVKHIFGLIMIGMAFYYIKPLYPAWLFNSLLGLSLVCLSSFFGAFTPNAHLSLVGKIRKGLMLTTLAIGIGLTTVSVLSRLGIAVPMGEMMAEKISPLKWQPYSQASLDEAVQKHRPVLIDFTAEWCGACQEMEQTTFVDRKVIDFSVRFALLRVDGTHDTPALHEILNKFHVQGFPTYIFFDSAGKQRDDLTLFGYENAEPFSKRMESSINASKAVSAIDF